MPLPPAEPHHLAPHPPAAQRRLPAAAAAPATALARTRRARAINRELEKIYPDARCELNWNTPLDLLVATVLSAQCTDERVNAVTPALFQRYATAQDYATATEEEIAEIIRPTGFHRSKSQHLVAIGQQLLAEHGGEVPQDMEALVALPGVGRKTAHVVRGNAFGLPGLSVDTHFGRLMRRFGLTEHTDPVKVEKDIAAMVERSQWTIFSHRVIFHGRQVCHSRTPACGACALATARLCPSFGEQGPTDPVAAARLVRGESAPRLIALAGIEEPAAPAPATRKDRA